MALLALTLVVSVMPARAQSDDERYSIMRPEKGTQTPQPRAQMPPPLYVPQTGQMLPNLPAVAPSGPGGRETTQDRAARCAHQVGVYGQAAGDRNSYIGSCINQ